MSDGKTVEAYLSVGSNIDPVRNVIAAVEMLARRMPLTGVSTFWRTEAIGPDGQPDGQPEYINGVLRTQTSCNARAMKYDILRQIERMLGRKRSTGQFAPRTIDLDLILFGQEIIDEPDLRIPAPEVERPFVAAGLLELDSRLVLPHTRQVLACLWPGGATAPGMTPDVTLTRKLKELVQE